VQEEVGVQKVIKVMLVEDHADFRRLVAALLGREPDLEVVAEASSLEEPHRHAARVGFDVAVLDMGLPDGNGADLIGALREANPDAVILVLSASLDPTNLARAKEAGADGILDKVASSDEIVDTIRRLSGG
jgi:DNA-binding NarL/FixJ family response regulator